MSVHVCPPYVVEIEESPELAIGAGGVVAKAGGRLEAKENETLHLCVVNGEMARHADDEERSTVLATRLQQDLALGYLVGDGLLRFP